MPILLSKTFKSPTPVPTSIRIGGRLFKVEREGRKATVEVDRPLCVPKLVRKGWEVLEDRPVKPGEVMDHSVREVEVLLDQGHLDGHLDALEAQEKTRKPNPRKGALEAIQNRRDSLAKEDKEDKEAKEESEVGKPQDPPEEPKG